MDNQRGIICLKCGNKFFVDKNDYKTVMENPICPNCCESMRSTSNGNKGIGQSSTDLLALGVETVRKTVSKVTPYMSESLSNNILDHDAIFVDRDSSPYWSDRPNDKTKDNIIKSVCNTVLDFVEHNNSCCNTNYSDSTDDLEYLERRWEYIGFLGDVYDNNKSILSRYNKSVGLYKHLINGQIMYIGRAVEYDRGGIRKRLSDYCRPDDSARKHPSGRMIHENRYLIETYVLVVGSDADAAEQSKKLESQFIRKYNPPWNNKLKSE